MNIAIYTFTLGRWEYLRKAIDSVNEASKGSNHSIKHFIYSQGVPFPSDLVKSNHIEALETWDMNYGIAEGMNRVIKTFTSADLVMKMDDDCKIVSSNFFDHIAEIHTLMPNMVFSPYPVGLIRNPGGPPGKRHEVKYSKSLDTYYTFRYVDHIGGFARIAPYNLVKNWEYVPDLFLGASGNEDGQHSSKCIQNSIPMTYLENAIIVEHQESTLGQHERYKNYFKGRF